MIEISESFLTVLALTLLLTSCGPNAEQKRINRIADSILAADSIAIAFVEQQRIADSIQSSKQQEEPTILRNNIFRIENFTRAEFRKYDDKDEDSPTVYEVSFWANNISTYMFSHVQIECEILFVMQNDNNESDYGQTDDPKNSFYFKKVQTGDSINVYYHIYCYPSFARTPVSITLIIRCKAISVDKEVDEIIAKYDLLPEWIEAQKRFSYR